MKKILLGLLALCAVACVNDETVRKETQSLITFEDSFVEVKTRAEDPSITTDGQNAIMAFDVWGFINQPQGTVFDAERVSRKDVNSDWTYDKLQWWLPARTYYFYAVAPVDNADIVVDKQNMNLYGLGNIDFTNKDGGVDLLYAAPAPINTNADVLENTPAPVKMQFAHLLSKIKFSFVNAFPNENAYLAVKNVKIVDAPANGNINVNVENWRENAVWYITPNQNVILDFGDVNGGAAFSNAVTEVMDVTRERLTIPADKTRSYTIAFTLELYYGNELGMVSEKLVKLENQEFKIGKNYNLKAVVTPENFTDEALNSINFEVDVDEWVENDFNGNFDWDDVVTPEQPEEPELPEEPTETYNIYLKNEDNWDAVYFYAWGDDFKTEEWPGEQMTKTTVEEVEYYVYALPAEATGKTINFLFNNGNNGKQTADIEGVVVDKNYFYTNYVEPAQPVETPEYMVQIPAGDYANVIFVRMNPASTVNDWGNKWNQTGDLKVADGNWFVLPSDSWDNATTTWNDFELAEDGYLYFNANDNWKQASARFAAYFFGNAGNTWVDVVEYVPAETPEEPETPETPEEPEQPTENTLTVAEFLALTDVVPSDATAEEIAAAPRYTLTGTITSVTNTNYGNFYLNDGTSEVLIYGLVGPNGESQYWATSGAKVGDDITVKTIRTEYNNAPQGKNATFVEVKTPGTLAFWSFEATAASFTAAGGEKTIKVDIYNATSEVNVTSDNDQFSAGYANGVLTITALENTEFEAIDGNVTITCGTLSQVIGVSQAAASSGGEQTEVTKELQFVAANRTSFNTSQQTWEVDGVKLVNEKGSSTSNVADYVNPARFYKSSKITVSADGNITTIVFDCNSTSYATALKDSIKTGTVSVASDKVTVTLDGSSNEFVISSLTGGQVRMDSMTVTYLE